MAALPRFTFLVGHKGVGRSTLLRRLAESQLPLWGRPTRYVDLDDEIQRQDLLTLEMILQQEGEAGLAARERRALDRLLTSNEPLCIALGSAFTEWTHPVLDRNQSLLVWVRRTSDSAGRIFVDRPRLNTRIPPLQEFEERARFRSSRFSRLSELELWLREGATTFSLQELEFLQKPPPLPALAPSLGKTRGNSTPPVGTSWSRLLRDDSGAKLRGAVVATDPLECERLATPLADFCARRKEAILEIPLDSEDAADALEALPRMGIRWAMLGDSVREVAYARATAVDGGRAVLSGRAARVGMVDFLAWDARGNLRLADCCSIPAVRVLLREWARRAGLAQPRQSNDLALWGGGSLLGVVRDEIPQALPPGMKVVVEEGEEDEGPPPYPRALVALGSRKMFREAGSPMPPEEWHLDWVIDTEAGFESPGREISLARGARFLGGEMLLKEFCLEVRRVLAGLDHF